MKKHEFIKDTDENGNETISVSDKPKRRLDLFPRLVCVLIAFIIWIWMVNLNDTDLTEKLTFEIEFAGVTLNDDNMMIIENGDEDIIIYGANKNKTSVTVQGSNRDIRRFEDENGTIKIDVTNLDLSKIGENGAFTIPFEFEIPEGSGIKLIESEPLEISFLADVYLEDVEIPLRAISSEELTNTGVLYKFTPEILGDNENETVKVSGPQKIVSQINSAKVLYDTNFVNSKDEMESEKFQIAFIGLDGKEIDAMNTVTYTTGGITVLVKSTATKWLNIRVDCESTDVQCIPSAETIEVSGPPSAIRLVQDEEYVIYVSQSDVKTEGYLHIPNIGVGNLTVKPTSGVLITFIVNSEK